MYEMKVCMTQYKCQHLRADCPVRQSEDIGSIFW